MTSTTATRPLPSVALPRRLHRDRPTPLEYGRKRWLQAVMAVGFVFLYFPIVALVAFSFNDSKLNITWRGFTLKYYVQAFNNVSLHEAFINSMVDRLAARLKDNGKDLDGWMRLARAYKVLGREGDAVGAVASARQNFAGDQAALAEIDKSAASLGLAAKQEPVTPQ